MSSVTCSGAVRLEANVTDPTSGDEVACEGILKIPIRSNPYQIQIVQLDFDAFFPCRKTRYTVRSIHPAIIYISPEFIFR